MTAAFALVMLLEVSGVVVGIGLHGGGDVLADDRRDALRADAVVRRERAAAVPGEEPARVFRGTGAAGGEEAGAGPATQVGAGASQRRTMFANCFWVNGLVR